MCQGWTLISKWKKNVSEKSRLTSMMDSDMMFNLQNIGEGRALRSQFYINGVSLCCLSANCCVQQQSQWQWFRGWSLLPSVQPSPGWPSLWQQQCRTEPSPVTKEAKKIKWSLICSFFLNFITDINIWRFLKAKWRGGSPHGCWEDNISEESLGYFMSLFYRYRKYLIKMKNLLWEIPDQGQTSASAKYQLNL